MSGKQEDEKAGREEERERVRGIKSRGSRGQLVQLDLVRWSIASQVSASIRWPSVSQVLTLCVFYMYMCVCVYECM